MLFHIGITFALSYYNNKKARNISSDFKIYKVFG